MNYADELNALKTIYDALRPYGMHERDRMVRAVLDRLARERNVTAKTLAPTLARLTTEHIEATLPEPPEAS